MSAESEADKIFNDAWDSTALLAKNIPMHRKTAQVMFKDRLRHYFTEALKQAEERGRTQMNEKDFVPRIDKENAYAEGYRKGLLRAAEIANGYREKCKSVGIYPYAWSEEIEKALRKEAEESEGK